MLESIFPRLQKFIEIDEPKFSSSVLARDQNAGLIFYSRNKNAL